MTILLGGVLVFVGGCWLLLRFNIVVMMPSIIGVTVLRHGYSVVVMGGLCVIHSGADVRADAGMLRTAQRGANDPDEHTQRRPGADGRVDFRWS